MCHRMEENYIGNDGAMALGHALEVNRSLTALW